MRRLKIITIIGKHNIHSIISSLNRFVIILYLERPLVAFKATFSISNISNIIFGPLPTKFCTSPRPRLVSLIMCFIVGSKTIDLETPFYISSQSEVDGDPNIEQVITFITSF